MYGGQEADEGKEHVQYVGASSWFSCVGRGIPPAAVVPSPLLDCNSSASLASDQGSPGSVHTPGRQLQSGKLKEGRERERERR